MRASAGSPTRSARAARTSPARNALVELTGHVHALHRPACLARAGAAGPQRPGHRAGQVRVGEHQHRVLAADLDRHLLLARDARTGDLAADRRRAREEDLAGIRARERDARFGAAVDDPHESLGQARARQHARDPLPRQARAGGRLEGHAVAGEQRSRDLPERLGEGRAAAPITPTTP